MMLYVKDRFSISGRAYHEMAKLCKAMPKHYKLKMKISELNHVWEIQPTPNGIVGVQQCLKNLECSISFKKLPLVYNLK